MNFVTGGMIQAAAKAHGLPGELVAAMVEVESSGDPNAWNPEPRYRWLWNVRENKPYRADQGKSPPADFSFLVGDRDQEWWGQQASWGPMQVMGAVGRELGLRSPYLTILCADPATGLAYGCKQLATLRRRHGQRFGWPGVVRAYNTGSPSPSTNGDLYWGKVFKIAGKNGWRP